VPDVFAPLVIDYGVERMSTEFEPGSIADNVERAEGEVAGLAADPDVLDQIGKFGEDLMTSVGNTKQTVASPKPISNTGDTPSFPIPGVTLAYPVGELLPNRGETTQVMRRNDLLPLMVGALRGEEPFKSGEVTREIFVDPLRYEGTAIIDPDYLAEMRRNSGESNSAE